MISSASSSGSGRLSRSVRLLSCEPEHIKARFIARLQLVVTELAPAAFRVLFRIPRRLALMAVRRVVALDEIRQVIEAHRLLFQGVVHIGAIVVEPHILRPRVRTRLVVIEKYYVGLDAVGVKDSRRQPQDRMQISVLKKLAADGFSRSALKKHVIGHDDGCSSCCLHHRADVLHEIELLVRCRRPKVLTVICEIVCFLFPLFVGKAHAALLAERRICQNVIKTLSARGNQRIVGRNHRLAVDLANVVQKHIHEAEAAGVGDDLVAGKRAVFQEYLLFLVEFIVLWIADEIVTSEEKTAGAACRIGNGLAGLRAHTLHHRADKRARV